MSKSIFHVHVFLNAKKISKSMRLKMKHFQNIIFFKKKKTKFIRTFIFEKKNNNK